MATHETIEPVKASKKQGDRLQCVVVTPERTLLDQLAEFIVLPLYDGELGILPGRSPLIGRLGFGELRTRADGTVQRYFIDGGFAEVRDDVVTVLTNRAIPAAKIDLSAATQELAQAQALRPSNEFDQAEKDRAISRARAQIHIGSGKSGSR